MRTRHARHPVRLLGCAALLCACALAPRMAAAQERGNPDFYARLAPYLWLSNIDGVQNAGGVELTVTDEHLSSDWAGRIEIGKGRLRAIFEVSRGGVANELVASEESAVTGTYDFVITSFELVAAYELGSADTLNAVEILAGFRHHEHEQILDLTQPAVAGSFGASFTDPLVGLRYFTELGGPFWFTVRSDIGGFDVGSKFTWVLESEVGIDVLEYLDLTLRYRYLETQFDNGKEDEDQYMWDAGQSQGWLFGAVLKW